MGYKPGYKECLKINITQNIKYNNETVFQNMTLTKLLIILSFLLSCLVLKKIFIDLFENEDGL